MQLAQTTKEPEVPVQKLTQAEQSFSDLVSRAKEFLAAGKLEITEVAPTGGGQYRQWQVVSHLDPKQTDDFYLRFGQPKDEKGAVGVRVSQTEMKSPEDGFSLRDISKLKGPQSGHLPLAAEITTALRSTALNEILTRTIRETASDKPIVGAGADLRIDLSTELLKLPTVSTNGLSVGEHTGPNLRALWTAQSKSLPLERTFSPNQQNLAKVEKLMADVDAEYAKAPPLDQRTPAETARLNEYALRVHGEAVALGYWVLEEPRGTFAAPIAGKFEFAPYRSEPRVGVCAVYDEKKYPIVAEPITIHLLNDSTAQHAGQVTGSNAMVNRARCDEEHPFLGVAHDEASSILLNRLGIAHQKNGLEPAPAELTLVKRLDSPANHELDELISCACHMSATPLQEVNRLLGFRWSQLEGRIAGRGDFGYNAAIDLMFEKLVSQPGSEKHLGCLQAFATGLKEIDAAKTLGPQAVLQKRSQLLGTITTHADRYFEEFNGWIEKVAPNVAAEMCADSRQLIDELHALRAKTSAGKQ